MPEHDKPAAMTSTGVEAKHKQAWEEKKAEKAATVADPAHTPQAAVQKSAYEEDEKARRASLSAEDLAAEDKEREAAAKAKADKEKAEAAKAGGIKNP